MIKPIKRSILVTVIVIQALLIFGLVFERVRERSGKDHITKAMNYLREIKKCEDKDRRKSLLRHAKYYISTEERR